MFKVNFFPKGEKKNKKLKKRVFIDNFSKLNVFRKIPEKFYFQFAWFSLFSIIFFLCFLALNRPIDSINVSGDLKRISTKSIENNTKNLRHSPCRW